MIDKYANYTEHDWEVFYDAFAFGQRVTASHINNQLNSLDLTNSTLLKQKRIKNFATYLAEAMKITADEAKELYRDIII